jgi:hypothetical protein
MIFVYLIIIGILLWLVNTYVPMNQRTKNMLNVIVMLCIVFWLLSVFGFLGSLGPIPAFHNRIPFTDHNN